MRFLGTRLLVLSAIVPLTACMMRPTLMTRTGTVCHGAVCQIAVKVVDCAQGSYDLDLPDVIILSAKKIEWNLSQDQYEFPLDGISIPSSDFVREGPNGSGKKFTVMDRHEEPGTFKYTIRVKNRNGTSCKALDPTISNQ